MKFTIDPGSLTVINKAIECSDEVDDRTVAEFIEDEAWFVREARPLREGDQLSLEVTMSSEVGADLAHTLLDRIVNKFQHDIRPYIPDPALI